MIDIIIWDEIKEGGSTYAYVQAEDISHETQQQMLESVRLYIAKNIQHITATVKWVDHLEYYPQLKDHPCVELLPKRWELELTPIEWDALGELEETLNAEPTLDVLHGYPITFISES